MWAETVTIKDMLDRIDEAIVTRILREPPDYCYCCMYYDVAKHKHNYSGDCEKCFPSPGRGWECPDYVQPEKSAKSQ